MLVRFPVIRAAALAAAAFSCTTSCSSLELPRVKDDPRVKAFAARNPEPLDYRVRIDPARVATGRQECRAVVDFPYESSFAEVLQACGLFANVRLAGGGAGREGEAPPDLALELRLHKVEPKFAGRNASFLPNLLLWSFLVFPSWWVQDETYRLHMDLEAVLISPRTGRRLAGHMASVMVEADLDDFQRGWLPLGILLAPDIFGARNWRLITEELLPHAARSAELELAGWIDGEVRGMARSGQLAALGSTGFCLCAGISKYESPEIKDLRWPRAEATALAGYLSDPNLGGVEQGNAQLLLDDHATAAELRAALERALLEGPRPSSRDAVMVYLGGHGAARADGGAFQLRAYGADPEDAPDEALSLKELALLVSRSTAARIAVVLDMSFEGAGQESALLSAFREIAIPGKCVVVHVSGRAPGAREAFARDFTSALAGRGDADGDGVLTALELRSFLAEASRQGAYAAAVHGEELDKFAVPFAFSRRQAREK